MAEDISYSGNATTAAGKPHLNMSTYKDESSMNASDNDYAISVTASESVPWTSSAHSTPLTGAQTPFSIADPTTSSPSLGLTEKDIEQLRQWNRIVPDSTPVLLHHLFSKQAQRAPDNNAVNAHDGVMTYSKIDRHAAQLSHILTAKGVSVGCLVPVIFEKSKWAVVSLLAVRYQLVNTC